jgi:hypothetical protein
MEPDRASDLLADVRASLAVTPGEIDRAHERFVARLEVDAQRGGWRDRFELGPFVRTWLRLVVLGAITVTFIAIAWTKCSPYERACAARTPRAASSP